jgi:hypothetical protein
MLAGAFVSASPAGAATSPKPSKSSWSASTRLKQRAVRHSSSFVSVDLLRPYRR